MRTFPVGGLRRSINETLVEIGSNKTVFVAGYSGHPHELAAALVRSAESLKPIRIITALMMADGSPLAEWPGASVGHVDLLHVGPAMGNGVDEGWAGYLPIHLSQVPGYIATGRLGLDAVCIQVSPPDSDGRCHFGLSVDVLPEAVAAAKTVIAQVKSELPRPYGSGWIPIDRLDAYADVDPKLPDHSPRPPSNVDRGVAERVADLIPDGATLQFGIGGVVEAVASALMNKRNLGVHSGLITDGVMQLILAGAVTNMKKGRDLGKSVATMAAGSRRLYKFIDQNPSVFLEPVSYTHNPAVLSSIQGLTAINTGFEIDLSGAVNAEVAAGRLAGAVGGQIDFARAARQSTNGRFIVALSSTAGGERRSRIVPWLSPRTPVTTPRSDTQWVVTEYGAVDVSVLSIEERAEALIQIAHPAHRRSLAATFVRRREKGWR